MRLQDMRTLVREHLGMDRDPTINEIAQQIASLERKAARGTLDDRGEMLAIRLGVLDMQPPARERARA